MKNQYFGDINDYLKYGLLRCLGRVGEFKTTVCWMLTPDDAGGDGGKLAYLLQPERWEERDPALYRFLQQTLLTGFLEQGKRDLKKIEEADLLGACSYHSEIIPDNGDKRSHYMNTLGRIAVDSELLFFDPDNGMQVDSVAPGARNSSKYLYWSEVNRWFSRGCSLLIYQHFPRKQREEFMEQTARSFLGNTGAPVVWTFRTPYVAFFLVSQSAHQARFKACVEEVDAKWEQTINSRVFEAR